MTDRFCDSCVLEESTTLSCHRVCIVRIGHLPFATEVLDTSGQPNLTMSMIFVIHVDNKQ